MPEKQTVLVVDDRGVDRLLLRKLLEGRGYTVLEAADGEEGFEMARFYEPDLIIADTLMPKMDGFGLLKNIKTDEKTKKIPCIVYSAVYTGYDDEKLARLLGAIDFIPKPIDGGGFLRRVEVAIAGANAWVGTAVVGLAIGEEEYLRRYSHVVAAKLEDKVCELEATNKRLQLTVADGLRAEDALQKESDRAQHYLDVAGVALMVIGANRKVLLVNRKGCEILGYETEYGIIGEDWFDNFLPGRLRDRVAEVFESVMAGEVELTENYENSVLTRDGRERIVLWHNTMLRDEDGTIHAILCSGEDITKRRRAEDALRIERDNLTSILESMEDGVYIVNQQYDIQYVNSVLKNDFGSFEGRKCYKYFHDLDDVCPWCKNPDVFAGETVHWEWHSPKNQRTYDLVDTPLKNPDGSTSKLEIFHDITERKAAQEALERKIGELRRFNEMAVDRELKMVELKKKINDLLQEMGKEPCYEIPE